jgi:hypothetical protein
VAGWSFHRKAISAAATLLALPLTRCSDPMSGFFALPKAVLDRGSSQCNAMGFKVKGLVVGDWCFWFMIDWFRWIWSS